MKIEGLKKNMMLKKNEHKKIMSWKESKMSRKLKNGNRGFKKVIGENILLPLRGVSGINLG